VEEKRAKGRSFERAFRETWRGTRELGPC